jgi:TonB family protein
MKSGKFLTLAIAAMMTRPLEAAPVPPPAPIEKLAELPFITDPLLSPDGRRIAARVRSGDAEALAIYDLGEGDAMKPKLVALPPGASGYRWAGNDRLLLSRANFMLFGLLPLPISRLSRYQISDGSLIEIGQSRGMMADDVLYVDPEGRHILLAAQEGLTDSPSVSRVDLATGKSTIVQRETKDIWSWFADASGTVRGGVSYDSGGRWTVHVRDTGTGDLRRVARLRQKPGESTIDGVGLLAGSNKGVIVTNEPTGRFGVYNFDLATASIGAPIFEHPEADVKTMLLSADGARVDGVVFEDELPRVVWFDPEMKKVQQEIDRVLKGKINRIVNRSQNGQVLLLLSANADDPGMFYIFDRKARQMRRFAAPFDGLVDVALAEVKPVRYAARDGLSIPAYLTLPPGRDPKSLPLIVMPHGGPFARDSFSYHPWVQMLATRGYAVLQPNFRGSTGFGRAYVERGYGQWGFAMQDDLDDGVKWLASQGTIDPRRVCMMGASYGGYAAMWGAIRNPETYRCAVSMAGVMDIRQMLKHDGSVLMAPRYSKLWRQKVLGEEKRDLAAISPLQQARSLRAPVLIAHGERDRNVPADQSRKLVAAIRASGGSVQAAFYPLSGHDFARREDSLDFMRRAESFLELHNPADAPREAPRAASAVSATIEPWELIAAGGKKKAVRNAVDLRFRVRPDGTVGDCSVTGSSGAPAIDKLACELAEDRFQYRPALAEDGRARESWVTQSLSWPPAPKPVAPGKGR